MAALQNSSAPSVSQSRRDVLNTAALLSITGLNLYAPRIAAASEEASAAVSEGFKSMEDAVLAYKFVYPTTTKSGKSLSMIVTHTAEKYSSAPPLNADARQRIVFELFDVKNTVTMTVNVGPASGALKGEAVDSWKPYNVAETVLIDRSTARLTTGQRTSLNEIENVQAQTRDGQTFWVYEHISQVGH